MKKTVHLWMLAYSLCFGLLSVFFVQNNFDNDYPIIVCYWSILYYLLVSVGNVLYSFNCIISGVRKTWRVIFPIIILGFLFADTFDIIHGPHAHRVGVIMIIIASLFSILLFSPTFKAHYTIGYGKESESPKRRNNILSAICAILCLGMIFLNGLVMFSNVITGGYWHFLQKDQRYYRQFARACDSILAQNPIGTNEFLEIPVTNSSVPQIIQEIHPREIQVRPNSLWIGINTDSRLGFAIEWEQLYGAPTNVWVLDTLCDGPERIAYMETNGLGAMGR